MHDMLLFRRERLHRASAALARDVAATTRDAAQRRLWLDRAGAHANAVPGSLNEALLIQR